MCFYCLHPVRFVYQVRDRTDTHETVEDAGAMTPLFLDDVSAVSPFFLSSYPFLSSVFALFTLSHPLPLWWWRGMYWRWAVCYALVFLSFAHKHRTYDMQTTCQKSHNTTTDDKSCGLGLHKFWRHCSFPC